MLIMELIIQSSKLIFLKVNDYILQNNELK